jgi:hypothetical protein
MDVKDYTSLVISTTALVTSIVTFYKLLIEKKNRKIETHIRFQNIFREIQKGFPKEVNDIDTDGNYNWIPQTPQEERNIEIYWYFVFDEWFFCNEGEKYLNELWQKFYSHGVRGAFKRPAFKKVIVKIIKSKGYMLGHKNGFKNELNRLYNLDNGTNLLN